MTVFAKADVVGRSVYFTFNDSSRQFDNSAPGVAVDGKQYVTKLDIVPGTGYPIKILFLGVRGEKANFQVTWTEARGFSQGLIETVSFDLPYKKVEHDVNEHYILQLEADNRKLTAQNAELRALVETTVNGTSKVRQDIRVASNAIDEVLKNNRIR